MKALQSFKITVQAGKDGKLLQMTNPSQGALDAGYKPQGYFHLALTGQPKKDEFGNELVQMKSESFVVFENQYKELFNTISTLLAEEKFIKTNPKENNVFDARLQGVAILGAILTANVPMYEIWNLNTTTGIEEPFMSKKRQPDGTWAKTVNTSNKVKVVYLEEMNVDPDALLEDAKDAAAKHRVLADDSKSIPEQESDDDDKKEE